MFSRVAALRLFDGDKKTANETEKENPAFKKILRLSFSTSAPDVCSSAWTRMHKETQQRDILQVMLMSGRTLICVCVLMQRDTSACRGFAFQLISKEDNVSSIGFEVKILKQCSVSTTGLFL